MKALANLTRGPALLLALLSGILAGCDAQDSDYYPYAMTALDVWVYDIPSKKNLYGGRVQASYFGRLDATKTCRDMAIVAARGANWQDWRHVCCTVTSDSDCVTKVR